MIRIDLSSEPKRWHTVSLMDENGEPQDARIQYALLDRDTATAYRRAEVELAAGSIGIRHQTDDVDQERAFYETLMARLDPTEIEERDAHLMRAIRGWDFESADGQPLPCDEDTKRVILNRADWFGALWGGLLQASEGVGKKSDRSG